MTLAQRATDPDSPLTEELQEGLLEALRSGLMPRYIALLNGVAPKTLYAWLDSGAKRDALQPYRSFCVRWVRDEAQLMQEHVQIWRRGGFGAREAFQYLERRWPKVWGKDADAPFEALQPTTTNAEDQELVEAIVADPDAYGLLDLFIKYDRLTTEERLRLAAPQQP